METTFKQDFVRGIRIGSGILTSLAVGWAGVSFAAAAWGALPNAGTTLSSAAWNDIVGQVNTLAGVMNIGMGNVGIGGVYHAQAKLKVVGNDSGPSSSPAMIVSNVGGTQSLMTLPSNAAGSWNPMSSNGDTALIAVGSGGISTASVFIGPWSSTVSGIRILSNGSVGIGTASPQSTFQVTGNFIQIPNASWTAPLASDCDQASEAGRMVIYTANTAAPANSYLYICPQWGGWVIK